MRQMVASTLSVVATFYRRPLLVPRIAQSIREQTRKPDLLWLVYEDPADGDALRAADWGAEHRILRYTPTAGNLAVSDAINMALDRDGSDLVTYLTDDSLPYPEKYERMAGALDAHPDWNAVYCSQAFGSAASAESWLECTYHSYSGVRTAHDPQPTPFCVVDHTQVMHRATKVRWPVDLASRRYSDGMFFNELVRAGGPLMPVPDLLDWTNQLPDGISARA